MSKRLCLLVCTILIFIFILQITEGKKRSHLRKVKKSGEHAKKSKEHGKSVQAFHMMLRKKLIEEKRQNQNKMKIGEKGQEPLQKDYNRIQQNALPEETPIVASPPVYQDSIYSRVPMLPMLPIPVFYNAEQGSGESGDLPENVDIDPEGDRMAFYPGMMGGDGDMDGGVLPLIDPEVDQGSGMEFASGDVNDEAYNNDDDDYQQEKADDKENADDSEAMERDDMTASPAAQPDAGQPDAGQQGGGQQGQEAGSEPPAKPQQPPAQQPKPQPEQQQKPKPQQPHKKPHPQQQLQKPQPQQPNPQPQQPNPQPQQQQLQQQTQQAAQAPITEPVQSPVQNQHPLANQQQAQNQQSLVGQMGQQVGQQATQQAGQQAGQQTGQQAVQQDQPTLPPGYRYPKVASQSMPMQQSAYQYPMQQQYGMQTPGQMPCQYPSQCPGYYQQIAPAPMPMPAPMPVPAPAPAPMPSLSQGDPPPGFMKITTGFKIINPNPAPASYQPQFAVSQPQYQAPAPNQYPAMYQQPYSYQRPTGCAPSCATSCTNLCPSHCCGIMKRNLVIPQWWNVYKNMRQQRKV